MRRSFKSKPEFFVRMHAVVVLRVGTGPLFPRSIQRRLRGIRVLAVGPVLALTLAACGSTATKSATTTSTGGQSQAGTQALNGRSFATAYPAGWSLAVEPLTPGATGPRGTTMYLLSSTGSKLNAMGIPPSGTIGITIYETPLLTIKREDNDPTAKTASATELANYVVGTPGAAQGVVETAKAHRASLGGAEAAAQSFTYTYSGHKNVQVDLVSQRNHELVLQVESDTEPALASQGQAALETIAGHWRWR